MTNKFEPIVMQSAEEEKYGQGRAFTVGEVAALRQLTIFLGFVGVCVGALVGGGVGLFVEPIPFLYALWGGAAVGALLAAIPALIKGVNEMLDGLRSYEHRKAQSFAQPQAQSPALPAPPILVKPYKGEPYVLGRGEPLALPDGRQSGLALNEPTIAAILQEVLTQHDGLWSRKRLMGLKVAGERITRAVYEDLTAKLAHAGFLQERPTGGYKLPPDVQQFDDLAAYFPNLVSGKAGGKAGRREQTGLEANPPIGGAVHNLAERHRLAWLARQREEAEHGDQGGPQNERR